MTETESRTIFSSAREIDYAYAAETTKGNGRGTQ